MKKLVLLILILAFMPLAAQAQDEDGGSATGQGSWLVFPSPS